jgi:hypothetical protein
LPEKPFVFDVLDMIHVILQVQNVHLVLFLISK